MTIYEIPNIEHCNVRTIGNPVVMYRVTANEGWYIHLNDGVEDTENIWKGVVGLPVNYDFSLVEIRAEADLPECAEICGGDNEPEHEVM